LDKKRIKAFTLAEIMIVLSVVGILTAILLPVAFHSAPDENIMKFKKANNTLGIVIRELVNSDKYYANGDLGIKADGTLVDSATYFCESMADILSAKKIECKKPENNDYWIGIIIMPSDESLYSEMQSNIDSACKETAPMGAQIVTSDDVFWYEANPTQHYGSNQKIEGITEISERLFGGRTDVEGSGTIDLFDRIYKVYCIDVDGIPNTVTKNDCKNECPFGYGIRADGKIIPGARANGWINKSVQKED